MLHLLFLLMLPRLLTSPLFPYTTLFRSNGTLQLKNTETLTNFTNDVNSGTTLVTPDADLTGLKTGNSYNNLIDRKSTRLNSSHLGISYAVFCLKKKKKNIKNKKNKEQYY